MAGKGIATFKEWEQWCLEHKQTPSPTSEDKYERELWQRNSLAIQYMRMVHPKFEAELKRYNEILSLYGIKRNKKDRIEEWLKWIEEHGRLPRRNCKDKAEADLANLIYQVYRRCIEKPEKYKEFIEIYETTVEKYKLKSSPKYDLLENYSMWKKWVEDHERLPKAQSQDKTEVFICHRMMSTLNSMRRQNSKYSKELQEYANIIKHMTNKALIQRRKEKFAYYRAWIKEHGRFPRFADSNIKEKRLAERLSFFISTLRQSPEEFKYELDEFEKLHNEYDNSILKKAKKAFAEWKEWVVTHSRLPKSTSKDKGEIRLHSRINRYLNIMRSDASNYVCELAEYEKILNQYSKDTDVFKEWKAWVEEHEKIPVTYSRSYDEEVIAKKMGSFIRKCNKNPQENEDILSEYMDICKKYNSREVVYRKNISIFNEWKMWCKANNRLPKAKSSDEYEADLHKRMCNCVVYLRNGKRKEIFSEYEAIKNYYKALNK